jgi:metallo-beta-lactamase family protein
MELQFLGAARTVTGSCFYLNTGKLKILVECGAFQGSEEIEKLNYEDFPFDPAELDYVFLTHAHFDHIGRTPLLTKNGFKGKIFCTGPTKELARIVLMDSARLQQNEFFKEPMYSEDDVIDCLKRFETYPYGDTFKLNENLEFRFRDAGHILGSCIVELWVKTSAGRLRKLVFSGDLGQRGQRIVRDPDYVREADYVCIEGTYGNRLHKNKDETILEFLSILKEAKSTNSNVIIPTFAIERTQEILYELNLFYGGGLMKDFPVFLDSPMASEATMIFRRFRSFYDEDAKRLLDKGDDPFTFDEFKNIESADESRRLVAQKGCIIMAGSGMCTGGRVLHHLVNNIENPKSHIIFVGYQVRGTLGRRIIDGAPVVKIMGKEYESKAKIHTIGGFSAHGDERDLRYWLRNFGKSVRKVFVCHADEDVALGFSEKINFEIGLDTVAPQHREIFALD